MAKKYKLSLENIATAIEKCPYVACRGPYTEDYEIIPSQEFLTWIDENENANYVIKVYRLPNETFFRVELHARNQKVEYGWAWIAEMGLFLAAICAIAVWVVNVLC